MTEQKTDTATGSPDDLRGIFPRNGRWGYRIVFEDYEEQKLHGWITPRLQVGDRFGYEMGSGRVGVFEVVEVDHQRDPRDMFFGKSEPVGYADDVGYDPETGQYVGDDTGTGEPR